MGKNGKKRGRPRKVQASPAAAPVVDAVDDFEAAIAAEGEDAALDGAVEAIGAEDGADVVTGDGSGEALPALTPEDEAEIGASAERFGEVAETAGRLAEALGVPADAGRLVAGEPSTEALEALLAANRLKPEHVLGWSERGGVVRLVTMGGRKLTTGDVLELRPVEKDGVARPADRKGRPENFLRPGNYRAPAVG